LSQLQPKDIVENIPQSILEKLKLMNRYEAYRNIHFPGSAAIIEAGVSGA
jgi:ATP-dependent DNA helicase RecG